MEPKPTRIIDIAARAGVSKATVSMALRGHPGVSKAQRERIQALAAEMGYRRNPLLAVHMASVRAGGGLTEGRRLAYLHSMAGKPPPASDSPNSQKLFAGACKRADELGYSIEMFDLNQAGMTPQRLSRIIWSRGIDGLLVGPVPDRKPVLLLEWDSFVAATMGYSLEEPVLHRACLNHFEILRAAIDLLVEQGHRRIGACLSRELNHRVGDRFLGAFLSYQPPSRNIRMAKPLLLEAPWDVDVVEAWMHRQRPDAILVSGAEILSVVQPMALSAGVAVFDFLDAGKPSEDVGRASVDLVVEQLHHNERGLPSRRKTVLIEPEFDSRNA